MKMVGEGIKEKSGGGGRGKGLRYGFLGLCYQKDNDSSSVYLLTFIEQHIVYFSTSL